MFKDNTNNYNKYFQNQLATKNTGLSQLNFLNFEGYKKDQNYIKGRISIIKWPPMEIYTETFGRLFSQNRNTFYACLGFTST